MAPPQRDLERDFELLFERHRRELTGYAKNILNGDVYRAEDAVQTSFMNAWEVFKAGVEIREPKPWLYRIVRNTAFNMRRTSSARYDVKMSDELPAPDDLERLAADRARLRRYLVDITNLHPEQKKALLDTTFGGRSMIEVGQDLGITEGAVRMLIWRARRELERRPFDSRR